MKRGGLLLVLILLTFQNVLPAAATEKEERKWQDESIYYLMIDRFLNGSQTNDTDVDMNDQHAYHGGDFAGIISRLDYIRDMGFTTIALSPVFANEGGGYHGFWVNDFYKTDEHFGTLAQFKTLVKEVHKRDMKIMLDLDVYHVGPHHPFLADADKQAWFIATEASELPALNLDNPETKQYMMDAAQWWIKETDIDGYRLLSVNHVPMQFWIDFTKEMKKLKEDFYLLGDEKISGPEELAVYAGAGFDGWMNYPLNKELKKTFVQPDHSFSSLFSSMKQLGKDEQDAAMSANFMDNENIVRFTHDVIKKNEHPGPRWKQALTLTYTVPGVPLVYYGSEIALDGGSGTKNHDQMNFRTDKELYDYIAQIGELRSKLPSLTRGTMEVLYDKDGAVVYKRVYEDETTVIAINNSSKTQTISLSAGELENEKELRGLLNGGLVRSADKTYMITIDRDMSEIYVLSEKTGINISYILAMSAVLLSFTIFMILVWRKSKANARR
ncbi:alpha-amylase family glycosyl hydrolase [Bacillus benzoevorans]|uniref:alpha-amylase n=1 Tax=Bacillus benzoevorans TaxID=1456 RepID=A0A7X0HQ02_9BACI|nr:alpha-amylase family glycosyl hydrolase [Bacillus benzoevorans]MBB6443510.1 alpha-amylase [Bacillus benzoevorans]